MVSRLGGWFEVQPQGEQDEEATISKDIGQTAGIDVKKRDLDEIHKALLAEFENPRQGNFHSFESRHSFSNGFSIFGSFPPLDSTGRFFCT